MRECDALLGENGFSKLLWRNACRRLFPRPGRDFLSREACRLHSPPTEAGRRDRTIYQEFSIVPTLTVAENVFLGTIKPQRTGSIRFGALPARDTQKVT